MSLSSTDFFIYGVLTALCNNSGKPFKISHQKLCDTTGLQGLSIAAAIKKLHSTNRLAAIWFGEEICTHVYSVIPVLVTGEAA